MEPSTGIGLDLITYHECTARKKLRLALSSFAPAVLTYLICSAPRSSASAQCSFFTSHALPAERNHARLVPARVNAGLDAIKITSEYIGGDFYWSPQPESDLTSSLIMDALLVKNFALLYHPSLLRCSHISYAPLLVALLPRNVCFLLRMLCRQSASG